MDGWIDESIMGKNREHLRYPTSGLRRFGESFDAMQL